MSQANVLATLLRQRFPAASVQSDISESGEIGFVDIVTQGGVHLVIECDPPLLDRIRALIQASGLV